MIEGAAGVTLFTSMADVDLTTYFAPAAADSRYLVMDMQGGRIRVSSLPFGGPGTEFSRILLGMGNLIWARRTALPRHSELASTLGKVQTIIGISFLPALSPADPRAIFVEDVARRVDALLFDGNQIFDSRGAVLMSV